MATRNPDPASAVDREMGPYRTRAQVPAEVRPSRDARLDLVAALLVVVVGLVPVVVTLARHAPWGVEAACGLLMTLFGASWLRFELRAQSASRALLVREQRRRARERRAWLRSS